MTIKSFFSVFLLSMFVTTSYAETTKEELKTQLAAKQEQLDVLGEKIMQFHSSFVDSLPKAIDFGHAFFEVRKQQLLSEGIAEQDVMKVFGEEFERFGNNCLTLLKNGTSDGIAKDAFFRGVENAPLVKFRMIKFLCDFFTAHELLSEWEKVSDEYVALASQLGLTTGLDTIVPFFKGCVATEGLLQQTMNQILHILEPQQKGAPEGFRRQAMNRFFKSKQSEVETDGVMPQPTVEQLTNQLQQVSNKLQEMEKLVDVKNDYITTLTRYYNDAKDQVWLSVGASCLIITVLCVIIKAQRDWYFAY